MNVTFASALLLLILNLVLYGQYIAISNNVLHVDTSFQSELQNQQLNPHIMQLLI